jgi:uncharacterized protein YuzE
MGNFKIDYDQESDDLFLFNKEKSKGSVEMGDLIIDFNRDGDVVGLEILNAIQFLKDSVNESVQQHITKDFLADLEGCDVEITKKNNFLFIKIILRKQNTEISCPINTPMIAEPSPALAYT